MAAAAAAAGCATPAATGSANPSSGGGNRIDIHHHIAPPPFVAALKKYKLDSPPLNNWTSARSLEDMDKAGVITSVASPMAPPALGGLPNAEAAAVSRASNEYAAQLARDFPGRFKAFALLPMPYVDETLKEIAYALDVLKLDGVSFMTSYGNRLLGDPSFMPVMDELNRRRAIAYTHPDNPDCCRNLTTGIHPVNIEFGTDTTRTIASLIFSGTATRCPDVKFIFSHAGGTVTALTERFTLGALLSPGVKERGLTSEIVMRQLQTFFYDTAQTANAVAMASLSKMVPTTQILLGSDYPFRSAADHVKGLSTLFNASDLALIERGNALRLLRA